MQSLKIQINTGELIANIIIRSVVYVGWLLAMTKITAIKFDSDVYILKMYLKSSCR